tara:strand:- start:10154 stop:10561 length:408 start_codon:yes stop_codon:yes gene_type:complete
MLNIQSKKVSLNKKIDVYHQFLSNLNNYKKLFPQDKITNWKSEENFCSFKVQNIYNLEMILDKVSENHIEISSGNSSPINFKLKIELEEIINEKCCAQINCRVNLSPALKIMVGKPLNELFNFMANQIEKATTVE